MAVRAIRGATQLDVDEREHLFARTRELVAEVLAQNEVGTDALISIVFTCTPDLTSDFPAAAAREMGLGDVPLLCAVEIAVRRPHHGARRPRRAARRRPARVPARGDRAAPRPRTVRPAARAQ
jgi:monofunctional chorismate mutase